MTAGSVRQGALAFVDIETTGGSYKFGRVLEVGVVRVENNRVVSEFKTLIHPGTDVPSQITRLTGIKTSDITDAPRFEEIASELAEVLDGAVFVAHNVQFDYGFLRMEFDRLGVPFQPKLLCTVKLSRKLFPAATGHKLQNLIERHGFYAGSRHRAFDDAHVLWQFYQLCLREFDLETFDEAVGVQLRAQSIPSNLDKAIVDALPDTSGVYIFEDEAGQPLYVGKSVSIRKRVLSHFTAFHESNTERRIAADIRNVRAITTHGELGALLTESNLVKELQPLHNRMLRKRERVTLALRARDDNGYLRLVLRDADEIDPEAADDIMAVYSSTGRARESLHTAARNFYLCPKLMNLEKAKGGCFQVQLKKCRGACVGEEPAHDYNARFLSAFENQRLHGWPYPSPVIITEMSPLKPGREGFVVDQWCLLARIVEDEDGNVSLQRQDYAFDLDMYKILRAYLEKPANRRSIRTMGKPELAAMMEELAAA